MREFSIYTADELAEVFGSMVASAGLGEAFRITTYWLYSGPTEDIIRQTNSMMDNFQRAHAQVVRDGREAEMKISGIFNPLRGWGSYHHFKRQNTNRRTVRKNSSKVMGRALSHDGVNVITTICGADVKTIVDQILPAIFKSKRIRTINGLSVSDVKNVYTTSPSDAFCLICLAEIHQIRCSKGYQQQTREVLQDYTERQKFFKLMLKELPKKMTESRLGELEQIASGDTFPTRSLRTRKRRPLTKRPTS